MTSLTCLFASRMPSPPLPAPCGLIQFFLPRAPSRKQMVQLSIILLPKVSRFLPLSLCSCIKTISILGVRLYPLAVGQPRHQSQKSFPHGHVVPSLISLGSCYITFFLSLYHMSQEFVHDWLFPHAHEVLLSHFLVTIVSSFFLISLDPTSSVASSNVSSSSSLSSIVCFMTRYPSRRPCHVVRLWWLLHQNTLSSNMTRVIRGSLGHYLLIQPRLQRSLGLQEFSSSIMFFNKCPCRHLGIKFLAIDNIFLQACCNFHNLFPWVC